MVSKYQKMKSMGFGDRTIQFKFQFLHILILAVCLWASLLTSLGLSLLICNIELLGFGASMRDYTYSAWHTVSALSTPLSPVSRAVAPLGGQQQRWQLEWLLWAEKGWERPESAAIPSAAPLPSSTPGCTHDAHLNFNVFWSCNL